MMFLIFKKSFLLEVILCFFAIFGFSFISNGKSFDLNNFKRNDLQEKENRQITIK
jgi:hypothetical protein